MSNASRISTDYVSDILDEIALEGLDGITTEALWKRLSVRQGFALRIDEDSKKFFWNIIIHFNDVKFYELPESRASLKYYEYLNASDTQKTSAALELDEVYPYSSTGNIPGMCGSCLHYYTRKDITEEVIKMSLRGVNEKWGNKLVIVASLETRRFSLLGNFCSPNIDFSNSPIQYAMLERVGRCRQFGIATFGKGSLQSIVEDSKSIFHYLKMLYHYKLIRKQSFIGNVNSQKNASRIYLMRFFEESMNENMAILQTAIEELKTRPNHMMECEEFYGLFDFKKKNRIRKYKKSNIFRKYITLVKNIPYRTLFPNASQSEWEKKSRNGEKVVRGFKLINPDVEMADIFEKEYEPIVEENISGLIPRGIYYSHMPILTQAYHHIKNSGASGLTHDELGTKMGLHKGFVRCLIKRLVTEKHCKFFIENDGRVRSKRYIVGENVQTKKAASEIVQILSESKEESKVEEKGKKENEKDREKIDISKLEEDNISYRSLKRIAMIIRIIKSHRFRLFPQIMKYVNEEETKEGLTTRVDKLTINRILQKLEKDGLIKVITLTGEKESGHVIKLYAEPTFEIDEKLSEALYHTHTSYNSETFRFSSDGLSNLESEFATVLLENLVEMKKMFEGVIKKSDKVNPEEFKESELVYSPKYIRLNVIHDFIFHLVYDYTGIVDKSQEELLDELSKTTGIDEDLKKEMPKLYGNQLSTYMFVPPLKTSGKMPGWFVISDLLLRMPLSLVVKIFREGETCPELWTYVNHPIRKNFLIKDLPLPIRQVFFNRKHQIASFYNDLRRLCFMGLLQFGVRYGREQYQTLAYLNKKASLLDTSTSPPEYYQVPEDMKFEIKTYTFETKADVRKYWMDLYNICMETNLGVKANMIGKEVLAEREMGKECLKKVVEPKSVEKVLEEDDGRLPGDNLGAAGLDSVMFSFLRSNWTGPISKTKEQVKEKKVEKIPLQKLKKDQMKRGRLLLKKTHRKRVAAMKPERSETSVSEEKPRTKKMRKVKEREYRFKRRRKTTYDEIDMEALKLMNALRVTWSIAEDNLLLICRVAMQYLCPNSRMFVRIPWVEVRRVLQQNLPESRNKTQKAIARRIVYMLKNPTTVRSVNLCLEELKEMPEASERFDCNELLNSIKPSTPNLTELQNQLYKKFHELVSFLKDRFIDSANLSVKKINKDLIPDSLEEFVDKFQAEPVPVHSLNVRGVRENVIRAILISSLCCRADKTSSAIQLFDIYRQYDDDELQNAIKKLHADKVITVSKKASSSIFKPGKILPLTFTPYKLSFAFQHMLNMKYTHSIYSESFAQVSKLLQLDGREEFELELNECNIALFILGCKGFVSYRTILPDQIIALDSGDVSDATYSKMLERYCEMLRFSNSNSKVVCSSGKIITKSEDGETLEIEGAKKRTLSDLDVLQKKKSRLEGEEAEKVKTDDEVEGVRDQPPATAESSQGGGEKMTRSSRVILYMIREEAKKDAKNESGKCAQEFCVVNASKVMSKISKAELELYSKEMEPGVVAAITKNIISRCLVPLNLVDESSIVAKLKKENQRKAVKATLDFISSKKELGATTRDLTLNCSREGLSDILKLLIESKVVIKSGVWETRYVSQKYCTPWLLNSFKMTRLEREKVKPNELTGVALAGSRPAGSGSEMKMKGVITSEDLKNDEYNPPACSTDVNNKIKLIIRPWIRIDGSLNRKVLDRFLGTVLAYIMSNPGISLRKVTDKFSPWITPVWTKDLVEILLEIGCITLSSLVVLEKATLFTKSVVQVSDVYTGLEDDEFVLVEPKVDAVTTLGLFIGKKTYSKDFLVE